MTLAGPAPTTTKRDGAPFVSNAAAPSGLSPAPAELITGLFLRGRAASACSARDHCALRVGAQRVSPEGCAAQGSLRGRKAGAQRIAP